MPEAYLVPKVITIKVAHFNPEYPQTVGLIRESWLIINICTKIDQVPNGDWIIH